MSQSIHTPMRQKMLHRSLLLIVLLGACLRFYQLGAGGEGNLYYAAAVKSMLISPQNFFFVAAEPGGSVTVDKPPLGLWVQALSALALGVNGFALALPQALAGTLSIPLLYHLVKRWFGVAAGLLAALALAVTPITVAVERNNTMDGLLVFVLLLAAWSFIKASESVRLRYLWLGALLVGLGFNIKMLQAFLPLPAFYGLYFLSAPHSWIRKIRHLTAATLVLLVVSLTWAVVVDLTPAESRPYIGSSSNNTVMDLITGYNGMGRLLGQAGKQNRVQELGEPGMMRLFQPPLSKEASWLLPLGLFGMVVLVVRGGRQWPLSQTQLAVVLWGGWLMTEVIFFSVARFYHAYYLIMLGPPLAALVGLTLRELWMLFQNDSRWVILLIGIGGTFAFQVVTLSAYAASANGLIAAAVGLLAMGLIGILISDRRQWAMGCLATGLLVIPAGWSVWTMLDANPNSVLPTSYHVPTGRRPVMAGGMPLISLANPELVAYLQAHTQDIEYLLAVPNANMGAPYILETGRPVLLAGGFIGDDPVLTVDKLTQLVTDGRLKYLLDGDGQRGFKMAIRDWLNANCSIVDDLKLTTTVPHPAGQREIMLYKCEAVS
ncbi:MAG: glycosyltransferase family 39 protein [Anaerolineae bacterium]|nr:glycosyltransferase family 39 protein [Anaerolineae bacterium]